MPRNSEFLSVLENLTLRKTTVNYLLPLLAETVVEYGCSPYPAGKDCQAYDVIISSKFFDVIEVHTYGSRCWRKAHTCSHCYHNEKH